MLKLLLGLGLTALLAVALASQVAWSRPKSSPGCPRHPVEEGAPCKQKHATCHWPCASEGRSDLDCSCTKDDQGTWRWQCVAGPVCTL